MARDGPRWPEMTQSLRLCGGCARGRRGVSGRCLRSVQAVPSQCRRSVQATVSAGEVSRKCHPTWVGALAVELVDEGEPRDRVPPEEAGRRRHSGGSAAGRARLLAAEARRGEARRRSVPHLPVDGDGLRLHAGDAAEDEDGAVEDAQRTLHLVCTRPAEVGAARKASLGRRAAASMVKSTWPGVSITLISWSPQAQCVAADWMVMPFSRSSSIKSILAPTPSFPRTSWMAPIRPV